MMGVGWFVVYGLHLGLSYDEAWSMPYGELADYIAMAQIMFDGAKQKKTVKTQACDFWTMMDRG